MQRPMRYFCRVGYNQVSANPLLPDQMRRLSPSIVCLLIAIASLIETNTVEAQYLQPLRIQNETPLIRIFNIPAQEPAYTLARGATSVNLTAGVSNYFTAREAGAEQVRLDGETQRITLRMAYGISDGTEAGIRVTYLNRNGGILDGVIDRWHRTFDLPRLGRDEVDHGLVNIRYGQGDTERVKLEESGSGLGDLVLFAGRQLVNKDHSETSGFGASLRGQISLPTGDPDQLRGSGAVNIATWLQASQRFRDRWSIYGNAGLSWLGPGDVLPGLQRHWMAFAGAGLGWQATEGLSLKIQMDSQSSAYNNTALEQLGSHAIQLSFGGTYNFSEKFMLDIGITENVIRTEVSPDLGFNISGRSQF